MRLGLLISCAAAFAACSSTTNNVESYTVQSELVLADVAGTFYSYGATLPRTHLIFAQTRLPSTMVGAPQYLDPDFTTQSGCVVNRYDSTATPYPNPDVATGQATYTGFAANLLALDGKTPQPPGVYGAPIPNAINCTRDIQPYYACTFGSKGGVEKIAGDDPFTVSFPAVAPSVYSTLCPGCTCDTQMVPDGAGGMTSVCEQHPLADSAHVTEDLGPGGGYSAFTQVALPVVGTPDNHRFVRVTVGGANVASLADVTLDGTQDISIGWNCSATAGDTVPAGVACPHADATNTGMIGVWAISSTHPRDQFALGTAFSVAQCFDPIDDPRATIILKREAIQVLLGQSPNGSVLLVAARLFVVPSTSLDHSVWLAEGRGQFALINHGTPIETDMAMSLPLDASPTD
ncbi:MAG TPA: hypothetical protein VFF06_02075 [Polyangia bacterium]|nr:hypothetical protein [Polyangia bacterium]